MKIKQTNQEIENPLSAPEEEKPASMRKKARHGGAAAVSIESTSPISGINNLTVADFWKWAYSDICAATIRGDFAEFLVKSALFDKGNEDFRTRRIMDHMDFEWRPASGGSDILFPGGDRKSFWIEVKSQEYEVNQDGQAINSEASEYGVKEHQGWDRNHTTHPIVLTERLWADIYIFCRLMIQKAPPVPQDILDIKNWRFLPVPTCELVSTVEKHLESKDKSEGDSIFWPSGKRLTSPQSIINVYVDSRDNWVEFNNLEKTLTSVVEAQNNGILSRMKENEACLAVERTSTEPTS